MKKQIAAITLLFTFANPFPSHAEGKQTAFDRITETGIIRCGYIIYPPQLSIDANTGKLSGLAYDLTERMAKDLHLKVEWTEEVTAAAWIEGLHNQRFDMLCNTAWATTVRAPQVLNSIPAFFTAVNAYARIDDDRFNTGISQINSKDYTIATIDGSTSAAIARDSFPNANTISLPDISDFSQLLLEVSNKKADLTFSEASQFNDFDSKNPGVLKNITPNKPVRTIQNTFFVDGNELRLMSMINTALLNLHLEGFVDQTLDKYENGKDVWKRATLPYRQEK
ncbi:MAG TPA: transporter substrate-binding domain-containing protein [Alphaproteobacteria bacterium]|nr:transporter substrate-binding domain-containing protein [Alphaproteobacteria bacterium]HOO49771.1 transporter substrate-binding domain-containing protein [Alphaproteobacteria bacterium]